MKGKDERKQVEYSGKFTNKTEYDMFIIYWRYLCVSLNPKSINKKQTGK